MLSNMFLNFFSASKILQYDWLMDVLLTYLLTDHFQQRKDGTGVNRLMQFYNIVFFYN